MRLCQAMRMLVSPATARRYINDETPSTLDEIVVFRCVLR